MNFDELHIILDNPDLKLSIDDIRQIINNFKYDCLVEMNKDISDSDYKFYSGEMNAFYLVLDLLEHLKINEIEDKEKETNSVYIKNYV